MSQSDKDTLVDRLRGIYTVPVNDGAGLLNGKDTFTSTFDVPPIHKEAAARIEQLERELAEARRERAEAGEQFSRFMLVDHPKALEAASRSASARIKIPTNTMEQEFQSHYRRGYEAGKAAALSATEASKP